MRRNLILSAIFLCAFAVAPTRSLAITTTPTCDFLSAATATDLYGSSVSLKNSMSGANGGMSICLFANAKGGEAVSLLVQDVPKGMEKILLDAASKGDSQRKVTPVAGLGERAMYTSDGTAITLVVFVHAKMVVLGIDGKDTPDRRAALASAMRGIIGRI